MLQVQSIACRRGKRTIFRNLNFTLNAGETLIITGANGSGKSSLLRCITHLLPLAEGSIMWHGVNVEDDSDSYCHTLHYIGHLNSVKPELTVTEMLNYWRALYGVSHRPHILQQDPFRVLSLGDRPLRYLSAGQKRRLTLSRLFLRDASLWVLDEPSTTLDKESQSILSYCIAQHTAAGGIAIVATHQDMELSSSMHYEMGRENQL